MNREIRKNKLVYLMKMGSDQLISAWSISRPQRFSDDESGLNAWIEDVKSNIGTEDQSLMNGILKDELNLSVLDSINDWQAFSVIFPKGEELRRGWKKSGDKKWESFLSWLKSNGITNAKVALSKMNEVRLMPKKIEAPKEVFTESPKVSEKSSEIKMPSGISDENFYKEVLTGLGAPITKNNMLFLLAWRQSEGGRATFNPFNTTQKAEGATNYNKVGVKNYVSAEQGIKSTIKTISNGRYDSIINALKKDSPPMVTADALVASPWGTSDLIKRVISGYEAGYPPKPNDIATA